MVEEFWSDLRGVVESVAWASVASVDSRGRPYTRVLHPVWEFGERDRPIRAWIGTSPTALKVAHLGATPFLSLAYWSPAQDTANVECRASWESDSGVRKRAWDLIAGTPPPMGYDPAAIWPGGPGDPAFGLLRLDPFRLRVRLLSDLVAKRPVRVWRPDEAMRASARDDDKVIAQH